MIVIVIFTRIVEEEGKKRMEDGGRKAVTSWYYDYGYGYDCYDCSVVLWA